MKQFTSLFILSFIALFIACQTDVELCEKEEHPHDVPVSFQYNWGKTKPEFIPSDMLIIANRIVNLKKTSISVNSKNGSGYFVRPNNSGLPSFLPYDTLRTSFELSKGTYKFFTFNMENDELDNFSVRQYIEDANMDKADILVAYRTYDKNDSSLNFRIPGWTDHNYYSKYLQYATTAVFYDSIKRTEITDNRAYNFKFTPKNLTQKIDLYFTIAKDIKEQVFTVDSVFAEVSGIPNTFNIATGYLNIDKTYKMMFPTDTIADTDNSKSVRCHAEIHVPGIIPNRLSDSYRGPGIMQVMIFCSSPNPSGTERIKKKFQGKINLYNTLAKTPSVHVLTNSTNAKMTKSELKLDIKAEIKLTGQKIVEATDDGGGIDVWRADSTYINNVDI